jgi:phage tail sheath protein FI
MFQVSPGVNVSEVDLTTIIPAVSTSIGAFGGNFRWGPIEDPQLISNEDQLAQRFGRPTNHNAETWFVAANFLAYSNALYVSRAASANTFNAKVGSGANIQIKNRDDYLTKSSSLDANTMYIAKWAGELGNSLKISVCDSANAYNSNIVTDANNTMSVEFVVNSSTARISIENATANTTLSDEALDEVKSKLQVGDIIEVGNTSIGTQYLKIKDIGLGVVTGSTSFLDVELSTRYALSTNFTSDNINRYWEYFNVVDNAPGTSDFVAARGGVGDQLHIVVVDENGRFSDNRGNILEVWPNLSRATDARGDQGSSLYYAEAINQSSRYVWFANHRPGAVAGLAQDIQVINTQPMTASFSGGTDGVAEVGLSLGDLARAYDKYKATEELDVSLILTGKSRYGQHGEGLVNYLVDNVAEFRKDCVVFASPPLNSVALNPGNEGADIVTWRRACRYSSYVVYDSGYKYQYDKYNDTFRWIPLNGDVAGTVVRTDDVRDPWFSPAGFNRGQIKNMIRLAFNPDKANRDLLFKNDINPVVTFPNQGTVLFGDKTGLGKPSAFDRINVRRLFIVLEKAIATASKFILFEFNDEFTRAQFRNLVEPYLRDVQGRRGIFDFRVVCDNTNNTPEVIDGNRFVGDIYIKPARSISFIQLNFIAVRTGVEFDEIVGRF